MRSNAWCGWCRSNVVGFFLASILLPAVGQEAPATAQTKVSARPITTMVLFLNSLAWVEETGSLPLQGQRGNLQFLSGTVPGTWQWNAAVIPQQVRLNYRPIWGTVPLTDWVEYCRGSECGWRTHEKSFNGKLLNLLERPHAIHADAPKQSYLVIQTSEQLIELVPVSEVVAMGTPPSEVHLRFKEAAPEIAYQTTALVRGLSWQPVYHLTLPAEWSTTVDANRRAKLQLHARLLAHAEKDLQIDRLILAGQPLPEPTAATTSRETATPSETATAKPAPLARLLPSPAIASSELQLQQVDWPAGSEIQIPLLQEQVAISVSVYVEFPPIQQGGQSEPTVQELRLQIQHPLVHLPAGVALVQQEEPMRSAAPMPKPIPTATTSFATALPLPQMPAGGMSTVALGTAAGLTAKQMESESERRQSAIKSENDGPDWARFVGTIQIKNHRPLPVTIQVVKLLDGEPVATQPEAVVERQPNAVGKRGPRTRLRWDLTLNPAESQELTFGYTLFLPVE